MNFPLLQIKDLTKHYIRGAGWFLRAKDKAVKAVEKVSLKIEHGETLGLVGESGCGKSTLGRLITRLIQPTSGKIIFKNIDITNLSRKKFQKINPGMQIIFQDPYASLDPRMKIWAIITESMSGPGSRKREAALDLIKKVGLKTGDIDRYPHQFSGGQRQRISIARALCSKPCLIVADEPVSSLDVSIQAQIINLFSDLKKEFACIFISHDLSVVSHISDKIAVMYMGRIVELGSSDNVIDSPKHPYTKTLIESIPFISRGVEIQLRPLPLPVPGHQNIKQSSNICNFYHLCRYSLDICSAKPPLFTEIEPDTFVRCWKFV